MAKLPLFVHRAMEWTGHIHTGLWLWEVIGGGSLIAALLAVYQKYRSEMDWLGIGAMFLVSSVTIYVALRIASYSRRHAVPGPSASADRAVTGYNTSVEPTTGAYIPDDAPSLMVDFVKEGKLSKLRFKNDKPRSRSAIIDKIRPVISSELYESVNQLELLPSIPIAPISFGSPIECVDVSPLPLALALDEGSPKTMDSVVIDYDDSDGNQFSRQFTLTRTVDLTERIGWNPGPICVRGGARTPALPIQSLAELREELRLGALGRQDAQRLRSAREILERKLKAWSEAWRFYALAEEAMRLRMRPASLLCFTNERGQEELRRMLSTPLSDPHPLNDTPDFFVNDNPVNVRLEKWRLQCDIQTFVHQLPADLNLEVDQFRIPCELSENEFRELLLKAHDALNGYAASLIEAAAAKATTS